MWAVLSTDNDGNEGLIATPMPLLCTEEGTVPKLIEVMNGIEPKIKETGMEMKLAKFTNKEYLEWKK